MSQRQIVSEREGEREPEIPLEAWLQAYARLREVDPQTTRLPVELIGRILTDARRPETLDDAWWQELLASGWTDGTMGR